MIQIYLLAAATLAFLLSPSLTEPFTGYTPGSFPVEQIDPPVQPAGYAFAIWGVIYIWLGVMAAYAVLRRKGDAGWQSTAVPLALSLGPGAAWLWVAGFAPITANRADFLDDGLCHFGAAARPGDRPLVAASAGRALCRLADSGGACLVGRGAGRLWLAERHGRSGAVHPAGAWRGGGRAVAQNRRRPNTAPRWAGR